MQVYNLFKSIEFEGDTHIATYRNFDAAKNEARRLATERLSQRGFTPVVHVDNDTYFLIDAYSVVPTELIK